MKVSFQMETKKHVLTTVVDRHGFIFSNKSPAITLFSADCSVKPAARKLHMRKTEGGRKRERRRKEGQS